MGASLLESETVTQEGAQVGVQDYGSIGGDKTPVEWTTDVEGVLDQWYRRVWAASVAHYRLAERFRNRHQLVGVPVVVLSAIVGTSLFATLNETRLPLALRVVVGALSVGAAVLSAIQTFFAYGQQADRHVVAADWYAAIRRDIEEVQDIPRDKRGDARVVLREIRRDMNKVGSQFPPIGEKEWRTIAAEFGVAEPPSGTPGKHEPRGRHAAPSAK